MMDCLTHCGAFSLPYLVSFYWWRKVKLIIYLTGPLFVSGCMATHINASAEQGFNAIPGLYATGDGTTEYSRTRLNPDGTYIDLGESGPTGEGTWSAELDRMCFDPAGDEENQQERCWKNGKLDESGNFISTREDNGQSYFIRRLSD